MVPNFSLKRKLWIFRPNLPKKSTFGLKQEKSYHFWYQYTQIRLGTKFYLKQTILIFWTIFHQKRYFSFKTKEVNITIKFRIHKLDYVPNFIVNRQFFDFQWTFESNLTKKGTVGLKQEKINITIEFSILRLD